LQELIRTALKNNYDLLTARERIIQARAQLGITRSNQLPQVDITSDFSGGKSSSLSTSNVLTSLANATFQLDLFGGLRRATEASRAQLLASEEARRVTILTLVSDVAADYFQLLGLDIQLKISFDTIKSQQESLNLTKLRMDKSCGLALTNEVSHSDLEFADDAVDRRANDRITQVQFGGIDIGMVGLDRGLISGAGSHRGVQILGGCSASRDQGLKTVDAFDGCRGTTEASRPEGNHEA
jgi:hypothetical protein